jgi:hypothetical protein
MSDAELLAPVPANDPPPADAAPPLAQTPEQEDAALDAQIEEQAIELPDGTDKLVPLSAVTTAREKIKVLRTELASSKQTAEKTAQLEQQLASLQEQLNTALPEAQAYRAALQAQPREEPQGPTPEEKASLEEIARDYDFYKGDGTLDLEKAGRHQMRVRREAEAITKQHIAPIQAQSVRGHSEQMLANAMVTTLNGQRPHPDDLKDVWSQLDPAVTGTKAGAIQAYVVAMGRSTLQKRVVVDAAPAKKDDLPPPLLSEKAGGRETAGPTLNDADKAMARQMGISDKDYADELSKMPAGWGKR